MSTAPSASEVAAYREHGYVIPDRPLFAPDAFAALRQRFAAIETDAAATYGLEPEQLDKPHYLYPDLFAWLLHPRVLDLVEGFIGPDIGLFTSHFISKPARTGKRVPWHEDSSYWQRLFEPIDDICTVWLAIDPSTTANGCLRVVPGSHRNGYSRYSPVADPAAAVFGAEIDADQMDARRAVDLVLEPNHCSVHHARIIHGSEPNRSPQRRCGLTMRYFSTRCRFEPSAMPASFQIFLARGRDHAGNHYGLPGVANQAWIDELLAGRVQRTHL